MAIGRAAVWGLAALLLATLLVSPFFYFPAVAEFLTPDADSAAIPIFSTLFVTLILIAPIVLGLAWFCLRRYQPAGLLVWRGDRPVASVVATILFFAVTIPLCWVLAADYVFRSPPLPAYEYYALPVPLAGIVWLMALRTALISKATPAP
jgi:hypothetical protein